MKRIDHKFGKVLRVTDERDADTLEPFQQQHRRCESCGKLNTSLDIGAFWCDPLDVKCFEKRCNHERCHTA